MKIVGRVTLPFSAHRLIDICIKFQVNTLKDFRFIEPT